jgi:hypothetical protein
MAAASGPLLPFVTTSKCCGAARQSGHLLQLQNLRGGELTDCGPSRRFDTGMDVSAFVKQFADTGGNYPKKDTCTKFTMATTRKLAARKKIALRFELRFSITL